MSSVCRRLRLQFFIISIVHQLYLGKKFKFWLYFGRTHFAAYGTHTRDLQGTKMITKST